MGHLNPLMGLKNLNRSNYLRLISTVSSVSTMAPRAYWKGYLKLSLVSCPVALFPASSEREKISFNQINKETGNRIRYRKVDAETGDEVDSADIIKGYEVGKGQYLEIEPEELEAWLAPGSEDTELGVLMELEVGHGETEVYPRVQA
jgi:hypothetical protein